jgi:hypothetical protein
MKPDRSNFWKMVDRTKPSKLRAFAESELRDCQDYFLEIQSDSTLPPNEIITASERLALIRSEIDVRHSDAKHGQTQRLARWAIGVGMVSIALAIISGVAQRRANKPTREELACRYRNTNCRYTYAHGIANRYASAHSHATNHCAGVHCHANSACGYRANTETNADRATS